MKRSLACLSLLGSLGCGGDVALSVRLTSSASPLFDPYVAGGALSKIRVVADGAGQYDDLVQDLEPTARTLELEAPFEEGAVSLRVEGLDRDGNLVAFGALEGFDPAERSDVDVAFRRNVALVTHRPNARQDRPAATVYVLDVASHTFLGQVGLPNPDAVGKAVTSRGGTEMLVTYDVGDAGFVGLLSSDTGAFSSLPLMRRQDAAFASPARPIGVAGGGGMLAYLDLEQKKVLHEFEIGGTVLDGAVAGDGRRAILVVDLDPGVVVADLTEGCTSDFRQERCIVALDVVRSPGGVALSGDGRRAYVVSSADGSVAAIDLVTLQVTPFTKGQFPVGVRAAAFSSEIQAVLAVQSDATSGLGRIHTFVVASEASFAYDDAVQTQLFPSDISADPSGRRALVIAAGTSSATAGLTAIETSIDPLGELLAVPIGTTYLYPADPDETFLDRNGVTARQRYQPRSVAILNGR